jgi:alpha-1,3-rhamnosyl/mannosyltransferase
VSVYAPKGFARVHEDVALRHTVVEMSHDAESLLRSIFVESTSLHPRPRSMDLVHHGGGTVPVARRHPIVLTVHDLQYLEYPEYFGRSRLNYLRWAMPRALRAADLITVPTNFVRTTVVNNFRVDAEDVVVVPHGIESDFGTAATGEDELRARHRIGDGPIVVYPAVTHPHKSHDFLLEVQRRYWNEQGMTLVLIGGEGAAEPKVREKLVDQGLSHSVRRLGRVSSQDRDGLIRMARAVVFPSEYEGFGAPVIEAMALGVPVITSDRACLPEVVDRAGLVLPLDVEVWGRNQEGTITIPGTATIALPSRADGVSPAARRMKSSLTVDEVLRDLPNAPSLA